MTMMVCARVPRGRLVVDEPVSLPDDADVARTVIADDGDDLDVQERARLHADLRASMAELGRGEVSPMDQVLAAL
jgi:hypothetical protein